MCKKSPGRKNPKFSLQLVFPGTSFNYSCLIRLRIMQKARQNFKDAEVQARSSLSSGVAPCFDLTNPSSWNAFDDGVLGRFLLYNQLIASWYLPDSPFLALVAQNSLERKKNNKNQKTQQKQACQMCTVFIISVIKISEDRLRNRKFTPPANS